MKKYVLVFLAIALAAFLLYYISDTFSPGSYGDAATYELNIGESDLIALIEKFKEDNPQFQVPKRSQLLDHRNNHWYVIYFYYPEEDRIIYTWTRPSGKNKTTFALVSVNDGSMLGKWKDVNKDLSRTESKSQIEKFEELILKKIREEINH